MSGFPAIRGDSLVGMELRRKFRQCLFQYPARFPASPDTISLSLSLSLSFSSSPSLSLVGFHLLNRDRRWRGICPRDLAELSRLPRRVDGTRVFRNWREGKLAGSLLLISDPFSLWRVSFPV